MNIINIPSHVGAEKVKTKESKHLCDIYREEKIETVEGRQERLENESQMMVMKSTRLGRKICKRQRKMKIMKRSRSS